MSLTAVLLLAAGGASLLAQSDPPREHTYYFPHLAVGAGWQTTLTYINYSAEEVICRTDFLSDHGTPLMVSFPSLGAVVSRRDVLPPGGSVHEQTDVGLSAPAAAGWARAACTGPLKASLLFRQHDSAGLAVAEAGVNAAAVPATRFVTFAEQAAGLAGTGVAYANPSGTAAMVTFTAKDEAGRTLDSFDRTLMPGEHGAQNMAGLFGLPSFTGSLEITSTEPIVSLSINAEAAPIFSSLPPGELDPSAQGATTYYFPHLAVGASWQTTITYINYSPQEVNCRTDFLSSQGTPLVVSFPGLGAVTSRNDALPPGGSVHEETDVGLSAPAAAGWARAACTGPVKASLLFRQYDSAGAPVAEAGVNAAAAAATRFVTFAEQAAGQAGTGVAYANPSATAAAVVTFTARDEAGRTLASGVRPLMPGGHGAQNMAALFGLPRFTGSLEIIASEPIVSLSINAEAAPVFSSLPPGQLDAADLPDEMLAPASEAAFNDLFVGKRVVMGDPAVYVDFVSPGRFSKTEQEDTRTGSYAYQNTGPNTATVTYHYDDGDRCTESLTFVSTTAGTATFTCNDGSSGGSTWWIVAIPSSDKPDLVVQTPAVSDSTPNAGQSFTLSATVRNQGQGPAATTTLRYYRSSDTMITPSDMEIGMSEVAALAASGSSSESMRLTAPSTLGKYYYGACVDAVADESATANNCSTSVAITVAEPPGGAVTDREVLEALYRLSGGPDWIDRTNWLSAAPLSEWFGVGTDRNGRVTSLHLPGNRLSGSIPPQLAGLANLQSLALERNQLSGSIPPQLADLANLQLLYLWDNQLTGTIPVELAALANLQSLAFQGNQLTGSIPKNLRQLSEFKSLDIRRTGVCIPADAAFQAWLETLSYFGTSGTICDGSLRVFFSASSHLLREGESVEVAVRLNDQTEDPERTATIDLTASSGGRATTADYAGVPDNITITAPDSEASFVFTAVEDGHFDPAESVVLGFRRPLPSGITAGDPDTVTVTIQDPGTTVAVTDREVLEALYRLTGGPDWIDRTNWLSDAPLSEWFGVGTDRRRVTSLLLPGNQLSGSIPPELADLANLQSLLLGGNQLSGPIPPQLADLANLQYLDLAHNQLSGLIPPELADLANLQWLLLGGNQLSGPIPPQLADLANLQYLDLAHNQLSGLIPPELADLANLQWLWLGGNQLSGSIPPQLADLANLQWLDLSFNLDLSGRLPRWLPQLPLDTLNLMATSLCDPEDAELEQWLATIEYLPSGLACGQPLSEMSTIDVAVFYTPAARRQAGGTAEIEAATDLMIAETNQAYEEGGVDQQTVLVAREETQYVEEDGSGFRALERLADPSDGYMDEVHAIRDRSGADLVHLIADVTDVGGVAFRPGSFGLTCADCSSAVIAHELGHNMGLSHDRYVDRFAALPYSYGYVNQRAFANGAPASAHWRTIMAYVDQCSDEGFSCDRILRFSNPNQTYLGDPLGVPSEERTHAVTGPADAVRALNITRHSVAAFRKPSSAKQLTLFSGGSQSWSAASAAPPAIASPGAAVGSGGVLFKAVAPKGRGSASLLSGDEPDPSTLRRREVTVDIGLLDRVSAAGASTALTLNLFDDFVLLGVIEKRRPTFSGGYALSGPLAGVAGGSVTLVINGSVVAGSVRLPTATYRIRPAGVGRHAIIQIDPSKLPQGCETLPWPSGREQ